MNTALPNENAQKMRGNTRWMSRDPRRNSVLPFLWRIQHSSRWLMQVVASELSLLAFILLVFMVFSKKWLYPSGSRFFQRCPVNVTNRIYTSVYAMSMGLLYTCKSWSCFNKGSGKDSFSLWTNHPIFVVAMICFFLALGLGLILTIWLHLPYLPHLRRLPYFGLIGTIVSFCEGARPQL
uniref:Outer dense fiber protein 4 n=1 Tax=Castor canadensis TaxID=51338 RepID=A0A8C0ZMF1_CASCN